MNVVFHRAYGGEGDVCVLGQFDNITMKLELVRWTSAYAICMLWPPTAGQPGRYSSERTHYAVIAGALGALIWLV